VTPLEVHGIISALRQRIDFSRIFQIQLPRQGSLKVALQKLAIQAIPSDDGHVNEMAFWAGSARCCAIPFTALVLGRKRPAATAADFPARRILEVEAGSPPRGRV
jgi:hypothetical protein